MEEIKSLIEISPDILGFTFVLIFIVYILINNIFLTKEEKVKKGKDIDKLY